MNETWEQEVDAVDGRMKEMLRTKAQLSDQELLKTNRLFLQELQKLQSKFTRLRLSCYHVYYNICIARLCRREMIYLLVVFWDYADSHFFSIVVTV